MFIKIVIGIVLGLVLFLGYVSTRNGHFEYSVSGLIQAPPDQVFPYISDLHKGSEWSPYERAAPGMKKEFQGPPNQAGGKMLFESKESGSGSLEILKIVPNESVEMRLFMSAPFQADNLVRYSIKPEGTGTRMTWTMSGDGGFMGKLVTLFIDCEKMVTGQFHEGIKNLQALFEKGASMNSLWINLPTKNLAKSREFYQAVGFEMNTAHAAPHMVSLFAGSQKVVVNLFEEALFREFIGGHGVANAEQGNEMLFSIGASSEEEVNAWANRAEKAGAKIYAKPGSKDGWMYGMGFVDPNGHRWNILFMDMSKMPK